MGRVDRVVVAGQAQEPPFAEGGRRLAAVEHGAPVRQLRPAAGAAAARGQVLPPPRPRRAQVGARHLQPGRGLPPVALQPRPRGRRQQRGAQDPAAGGEAAAAVVSRQVRQDDRGGHQQAQLDLVGRERVHRDRDGAGAAREGDHAVDEGQPQQRQRDHGEVGQAHHGAQAQAGGRGGVRAQLQGPQGDALRRDPRGRPRHLELPQGDQQGPQGLERVRVLARLRRLREQHCDRRPRARDHGLARVPARPDRPGLDQEGQQAPDARDHPRPHRAGGQVRAGRRHHRERQGRARPRQLVDRLVRAHQYAGEAPRHAGR
mmetsp:Transcript_15516/g.36080  ORF Transcript_15516/g.36080 Transcript_15516/m.36080 type:complete len:317 (-) Transcript_15516:3101-4051(-)